MEIRVIVTGIFLGIGCALIIIGSIGLIRFPDFYTRIHAAGKTDTVGQAFVAPGVKVKAVEADDLSTDPSSPANPAPAVSVGDTTGDRS